MFSIDKSACGYRTFPTAASPSSTSFTLLLGFGAFAVESDMLVGALEGMGGLGHGYKRLDLQRRKGLFRKEDGDLVEFSAAEEMQAAS